MWVFGVLALSVVPLAKMHMGRVPWQILSVPAVILAASLLNLPSMGVTAFDLALFFASLVWILFRSKRVQLPLRFAPAIFLPIAAGLIPLVFLGTTQMGKTILVGPAAVTFLGPLKHASIERDKLDITYESAWVGPGFYWGFYGPSNSGGTIPSNAVYVSSDHRLLSGDDVAKRLAAWSDTTPRHVVNGDPRTWHDPHPPVVQPSFRL